jgi:hypothetical protein
MLNRNTAVMLCLALGLASGLARAADWEVLKVSQDHVAMVDKNSIHQDSERWKAWAMESYKETVHLAHAMFPHKSRIVLYEIDCHAGELGYVAWSFQSGELGGGSTVWADRATEVVYFPPDQGSSEGALVDRVCGTRLARDEPPGVPEAVAPSRSRHSAARTGLNGRVERDGVQVSAARR